MKHLILSALLLVAAFPIQAENFDHSGWNGLLNKHIVPLNRGTSTEVDYAGFARDRFQLKAYLGSLEAVSQSTFDRWSQADQLAFLINAYNAWTIELILSKYPSLDSIKELGSWLESPWERRFVPLLGAMRTLDEIEHELIRGDDGYREPRIHFAVNCASIGCPALSAEAYTGDQLERQLEEATRSFLRDRSRNRLNGDTLNVSKIFKWYRDDFERGWGGYRTLEQFFVAYSAALELSERDKKRLNGGEIDIEFLDYDWKLNKKR